METIEGVGPRITLYINGQGEFNEGLAQMVGKWGAYQFFEKTKGPSHPQTIEAMASIEDERLFSFFLDSVLEELQHLYDSALPLEEKLREREKVFMRCQDRFEGLKRRLKSQRFSHFGQAPLNNAYLMVVSLYHRNFPLFESVLQRNGYSVRDMFLFFRSLSEKGGNLLEMTRNTLEE